MQGSRVARKRAQNEKKCRGNVLESPQPALYSAPHCRLSRHLRVFSVKRARAHTEAREMWKQREEPTKPTSVPASPAQAPSHPVQTPSHSAQTSSHSSEKS